MKLQPGDAKFILIMLAIILAGSAGIAWTILAHSQLRPSAAVKQMPQYQACEAYLKNQVHPNAYSTAEQVCLYFADGLRPFPSQLDTLRRQFTSDDYGKFNRYLLNAGPIPSEEQQP